ncbi:MAG: DAK2 domain-containing protein, partial [Oscillospiraceae bacterium]|nr:DAK2 domain-containing protein [Oscillospiraceae bacterium]
MINGSMLRDAFLSASNNIKNNKSKVDELNVFPVPDGDTGTNMSMTISAAAREIEKFTNDVTASSVASTVASALLRGARGNSGVILSLLFRGFAKGIKDKAEINGTDIANAFEMGVKAAYKAVMKPTEGTILTVARLAAEKAKVEAETNSDAIYIWNVICDEAKVALDSTPELLPVLKKAGVVDAGGMGLLVILKGMKQVFEGGEVIASEEIPSTAAPSFLGMNPVAEYEGEITFTYCTEFLVVKEADKAPDSLKLRAYLESIGDSCVVVDDDTIIKCHVHTDNPGNALQEGLKYGSLINLKIENMREQHANAVSSAKNAEAGAAMQSDEFKYAPVDPEIPYGFVSVAAGDGIEQLFTDLGVNNLVRGGQTMNPSTEDILRAIHATPAKTVFVLPNNKNIIMAAEQTIRLADRNVCVIPTRTIPQGLSALLAFDEGLEVADIRLAMTKAADNV